MGFSRSEGAGSDRMGYLLGALSLKRCVGFCGVMLLGDVSLSPSLGCSIWLFPES